MTEEVKKTIESTEATPDIKAPAKKSKGKGKRGIVKQISSGRAYIKSTYNNTRVSLTDLKGNLFFTSSSGSLGYRGAKKGTPFAASKVGEIVGEQALGSGVKKVQVVVKGVGAGRESAIRSFMTKGIEITSIKDVTPVPHNGPKPKKPRRV